MFDIASVDSEMKFLLKNIYFKYVLSYFCILNMNLRQLTLDTLDTINQPSYSPRPKKACTYCPQIKLIMVTVKYLLTERIWLYIFMSGIAQSVPLNPKLKMFLKNIKFKITLSSQIWVFFPFEFLRGTAEICHTSLWGFSKAL